MPAWIEMISDEDADSALKSALVLARTPHGTVDNVMRVHSLRPETMNAHVGLYRACLHNSANTVPMWFQEVIASYVSRLNDCSYSYANHWSNACHLIDDKQRSDRIEFALQSKDPATEFTGLELTALEYSEKLTIIPGSIIKSDVAALSTSGWDDGQILEINQIVGYFNYANRLLNGLGVTTVGDMIGYYSKDKKQ